MHQNWLLIQFYKLFGNSLIHPVVEGGAERFDSVKNGLKLITEEAVVAIHDAVRPLVSAALILAAYHMALEKGNAIAAIQPVDSVRIKKEGLNSEALNRDELYLIQTPQTFKTEQLHQAYLQDYSKEFTDDASVVLIILWVIGFFFHGFGDVGGLIHVLLVIAVIAIILKIINRAA